MASIVDTSVKHFRSSMVAAPVLSGTAGSLIALLDACLVTGFDVKSATSLVVVGGVATLSFTGSHSAVVDSVILVDGASISALNGEQKVTAISAGVVKFATSEVDATATGTITFKMAPAGWAKPFAGVNIAAFKSANPTSTGMFLRVDDTGTMQARVVGYESMIDVSTGLGAFPLNAQMAGGGYWPKSTIANTNANVWYVFADSRMVLIHVQACSAQYGATYSSGFTHGFGDAVSFRPGGDAYACFLSYSANAGASYNNGDGGLDGAGNAAQRAFPRGHTGQGASVLYTCNSHATSSSGLCSGMDPFFGPFPSQVDGVLRLSKRSFQTAQNTTARAELPALYFVPMSLVFDSFPSGTIISGSGELTGRKLFAVTPIIQGSNVVSTSSNSGVSFIDITGPWR